MLFAPGAKSLPYLRSSFEHLEPSKLVPHPVSRGELHRNPNGLMESVWISVLLSAANRERCEFRSFRGNKSCMLVWKAHCTRCKEHCSLAYNFCSGATTYFSIFFLRFCSRMKFAHTTAWWACCQSVHVNRRSQIQTDSWSHSLGVRLDFGAALRSSRLTGRGASLDCSKASKVERR